METKNVETKVEAKQVYFGRGEYAITSDNYQKLATAAQRFSVDGGWKWALQDSLGIKMDGSLGRRFTDILATKEVPEELKEAMALVKPRESVEVFRFMLVVEAWIPFLQKSARKLPKRSKTQDGQTKTLKQ